MKRYVKAGTQLSDQEIKEMFSKEILQMSDKSAEYVLRKVLFSNNIDWQKAYQIALEQMPELTLYRPDEVTSASDIDDDYGPGEHIPTPIEKVKKGDFFKLSDKPNGKVYVKDDYDKSERAYWCYEYYDVNSGRYFKKGKTVYTGFTF